VGTETEAIVFTEPYKVDFIKLSLPTPGPKDVAVRTIYSGISIGTERWWLTGRYNHCGEAVAQYYPYVPGYQRSGIVEAVGPEVTSLAVGDRVFSRGGKVNDPDLMRKGWFGHSGYVIIQEDWAWKLGANADMEEASLWQMPAVGAHGVRLTRVQDGELVVLIGQGMIGQLSAQMARLRGATVIATDLVQKRVDLSGMYSADIAVNNQKEDVSAVIRSIQPDGADVVIDTTGNSRLFDYCRELIRYEGRICLQGYYPEPFQIDFHPTHEKRATVTFPCGREDPNTIVPLLNRHKMKIKPLITHRFPIKQAREAYDLILNRPEEAVGVIIDWT
jgi:2-desacetyl-2-hydroxyethyl bacteriochlorophyllide A dehydrogenase